ARRARGAHRGARPAAQHASRRGGDDRMSSPLRVLVVDDDGMYLELVERSLRGFGMDVTTTDSSLGVSNLIRRIEPDVVLLDVNIPALSGDALLGLARRTAPERTKFVLFS